jgi:hypothetical protein
MPSKNTHEDPQAQSLALGEKNSIELQLLKQSFEYMKKGIDDINTNLEDLKKELKDGFVNKDQFKSLETRVITMENGWGWVIKIIIGSVIISLLALLGLKR